MSIIDASIKSSQIVCKALGLEPAGVPAEETGICAMCGTIVNKGDLCAQFQVGPSFMDDLTLAARGSEVVCGWCVPNLTKEGIMSTGYGVYSLEGFRPFRKWADVATQLLDPPEPPFVMVQATANNQHMAWRAPVNWSRDVYYIRLGLRDAKIRRKYLLEAIEACARLAVAIEKPETEKGKGKKKPERKMRPHPFVGLSRDLKENSEKHGQLKLAVYDAMAKNMALKEDVELLTGLTIGESWALLFVLQAPVG